jgi:hypothetical protein
VVTDESDVLFKWIHVKREREGEETDKGSDCAVTYRTIQRYISLNYNLVHCTTQHNYVNILHRISYLAFSR